MSPSDLPTKGRVGLRDVAAAAHVCAMTVSLALRDNPRIPSATRERIKRLAAELGYRPDPEISRLMNHLRAARTVRGRVGIALVDFYPSATYVENCYNAHVRAGAERRAAELGFTFTALHAADYPCNFAHLLDVVRARGLEGALLLPPVAPLELASAEWDDIAVLVTSKAISAPRFHCIVPNQFGNTMRLLEAFAAHGRRRVCAIFDEMFDERTGRNFTAAVNRSAGRAILIVPQAASRPEKAMLVARWLARQQPDAVFAQSDAFAAALPLLQALQPPLNLQVITLNAQDSAGFSYLDERADLIGSAAVDLLAGMMHCHETGVPAHPRTTLIDGELALTPNVVGTAPPLTGSPPSARGVRSWSTRSA